MKSNECFLFFILIIIINQSNQQKLSLTSHQTDKFPLSTGTWKDLLGLKVECPNRGVLKNFVLQKNSTHVWYDFNCYSSKDNSIDEGEPIIKGLSLNSTYKYTISIQENIRTLSDFPIDCWVDYGLASFKIYNDSKVLRRDATCYGLKAKYTSKFENKTESVTTLATRIDGLVGITVGSTEAETDDKIAYPLRGFKYDIDISTSKEKPTVSYYFAYSILRNMEKEKQKARETFENLRNSNTQKD
jgi:hypothetical protein